MEQLKALQKKYKQIGDVDGIGLALRVEMCEADGYTPNKKLTDAIANIGLERQSHGRRQKARPYP